MEIEVSKIKVNIFHISCIINLDRSGYYKSNLDGKSRGGSRIRTEEALRKLTQESRENLRSFGEKFFSLFSALSRTE